MKKAIFIIIIFLLLLFVAGVMAIAYFSPWVAIGLTLLLQFFVATIVLGLVGKHNEE